MNREGAENNGAKDYAEYDVIVVGAGVSGLMLAKLLNETNLNVLLIENRDTIKAPWNHRYGTTMEVIEKFGLEEYVVNTYNGFEFLYSHSEKAKFSYDKKEFCVVDITPFARNLQLRFDVKTSTTIKGIQRKHGHIFVTDQREKVYKSKIIVDCSGESKIVSKHLGQIKKGKPIDFYSISLELENCDIPQMSSFQFIADLMYVNSAFWFYPYSTKKCQFGSTEFLTAYPDEKTQYEKVFEYIRNESPFKDWLKNCTVKEKVFKIGPAATVNLSLAEDNFLACGNAAGAGTPVVGEGFRVAVEMAQSAFETILVAFNTSDFSRNTLIVHEQKFNARFGTYYKYSKIIRFFVMNCFTPREYRLFVKNVARFSAEESKQILTSRITMGHLVKLLDIPFGVHVFRNLIKFLMSGCKPVYNQTVCDK